jgi:undecaprenyl-diphosphatase
MYHMDDRRAIRYASRNLYAALGAFSLLLAASAFMALAGAVVQGRTQEFDEQGVRDLRQHDDLASPVGPSWLKETAQDFTALGGVTILSVMTFAMCGFLLVRRRSGYSAIVVTAVIVGGLLATFLMKGHFGRPRPHLVPYLCVVDSSSFPSGHAMMSAVVYLTVAAALAQMTERRQMKIFLFGAAMVITGLVGVSRVYLGVHYPTDVLAGWLGGLIWLAVCWLLVYKILASRQRDRVL